MFEFCLRKNFRSKQGFSIDLSQEIIKNIYLSFRQQNQKLTFFKWILFSGIWDKYVFGKFRVKMVSKGTPSKKFLPSDELC